MKINKSIYYEASLDQPVSDISIWLKKLVSDLHVSLVQGNLVQSYTLYALDEEFGSEGKSLSHEQPPTSEESWGNEKRRSDKKTNRKIILSCLPTEDLAEKTIQGELSKILGTDEIQTGIFEAESNASQKLSKDGWMSQLSVISGVSYLYGRYYMRRLAGDIKEADGEYLQLLPESDEEVESLSQQGNCGKSLKMLDEYFQQQLSPTVVDGV